MCHHYEQLVANLAEHSGQTRILARGSVGRELIRSARLNGHIHDHTAKCVPVSVAKDSQRGIFVLTLSPIRCYAFLTGF